MTEQVLVVDEFLLHLMEQHAETQADLDEAMKPPEHAWDQGLIRKLKAHKLGIKTAAQGYVNRLPRSSYAPIIPSLCVLADKELSDKIESLQLEVHTHGRHGSSGAKSLAVLQSELKDAERERDRRAFDALMAAEPERQAA